MGAELPYPIVDFHNHHIDARWTPTTAIGAAPDQRARWEVINRLLADETALLADIEAGDITARVVNTSTALIADPDGNVPAGIFEPINDSLAELVARHPGQLYGLASVDAFAGEAAARELTRAVRDLGLRGVFLESAKGELLLDAPQARPTLATAAALGVPVFVHPINPRPLTRQLAPYGRLGTLFARGTINAASLIALLEGGVFDELPNLQVVVTTLAIGAILLGGGLTGAKLRSDTPSLLRRHVYIDTMGFDPALIRSTAEILGVDHVLVGSDWPIVNDKPIRARVERSLAAAGLDLDEQRLVAAGNSSRLLGVASAAV
jgi:predicted TIM-barrel fold metal-dependent hydrolase